MKTYALIAALALALPGVADARKITYYSDRDRDGHYVKRTKNVPDYRYGGYSRGYSGGYYSPRYYGRSHYGRSYYGRSYLSSPYYYSSYRPYYYGGYSPYYYGSPGLSFVYTSPRYSTYRTAPSYRSTVSTLEMDVQRELKRRGYYYGRIDGDIGPASREAIRSYQADRGLSVTGRIDSRLMRSLGI
jgi:hypothetical protein